jgi:hypothetical protein
MRKAAGFSAVLLLILVLCAPGVPRVAEISPAQPLLGLGDWPDDVRELVNSRGRMYGYFFNAVARLFFAGDADDFNWFLGRYAGLKDSPKKLILHCGPGKTKRFGGNEEIAFDWEVSVSPVVKPGTSPEARPERTYVVTVGLCLGGQVELDKVNVPANVLVQTDVTGKTAEEVAEFIAEYQRKRTQAEATEKGVQPKASSTVGENPEQAGAAPVSSGDSAEALDSVVPQSEKPLYAKVALNEDGSKVLSVMFDESQGTRRGYDVLYADANFSGRFEPDEKRAAKTEEGVRTPDFAYLSWSFPPLALDMSYDRDGRRVTHPCQLIFHYRKQPIEFRTSYAIVGPLPTREEFSVSLDFGLQQDSAEWQYSLRRNIHTSDSLDKASLCLFDRKPKVKITTQPSGRQQGNLGIKLDLVCDESVFQCLREGRPTGVHVEIKSVDGKVVHQGDAPLSQFWFG